MIKLTVVRTRPMTDAEREERRAECGIPFVERYERRRGADVFGDGTVADRVLEVELTQEEWERVKAAAIREAI